MKIPGYLQPCIIETCHSLVGLKGGRGYCNAHYKRYRFGKDMRPPIQDRGAGWISTHGYRYIGKVAEHRSLMEEILGRKLDFNEVVHHKDENPLNNDPDNLEVMYRGDHSKHHNLGKTNEERKKKSALQESRDERSPHRD